MNKEKFTSKPSETGYYWCNSWDGIDKPFVCFVDVSPVHENSKITLPSGERVFIDHVCFKDPTFYGPLSAPKFEMESLVS